MAKYERRRKIRRKDKRERETAWDKNSTCPHTTEV